MRGRLVLRGGSAVLVLVASGLVVTASPHGTAARVSREVAGSATRALPRLVQSAGQNGPSRQDQSRQAGHPGGSLTRSGGPLAVGSYQQVLINGDRARFGLPPLSWSDCLAAVAVANARRMAAQGYISHTSGPWADLGCHLGAQGGENVGWWSGGVNDAQLNSMFMASWDHRANILGPYHYVATAWAVGSNGYAYIAVEFT